MNSQELGIHGIFTIEQWRGGLLYDTRVAYNKITNSGKKNILDEYFDQGDGYTWYCALIDGDFNSFTSDDPDPSANEFDTYDEATRAGLIFQSAAVGAGGDAGYIIKVNSTANYAIFTISTGVTGQVLDGIFVCNAATGGTYTLWCTAAFGNNDAVPVPITVNAADVLKVQYKIRIPV
jgi:hypothetical protein